MTHQIWGSTVKSLFGYVYLSESVVTAAVLYEGGFYSFSGLHRKLVFNTNDSKLMSLSKVVLNECETGGLVRSAF